VTDLEAKLIEALRAALADEPDWRATAEALSAPASAWGCHVELDSDPDAHPDGCVIDDGDFEGCAYAAGCSTKEQCRWWAPKTAENLLRARRGDEPVRSAS
jgi:hypothetical protein